MTGDLVSGLLSAIEQREKEHHRAAEEIREAARLKVSSQFGDYILGTIADGIGLCRAHRKIIELYEGAVRVRDAHPDHAGNQGYLWALEHALTALADGLGLREENNE